MIIGIGADHNAFEMKKEIAKYVKSLGYTVIDYGSKDPYSEVDYPSIAFNMGEDINNQKIERGILICGTGIGMAIAACKIPGIRAALCHDTYSAERSQKSNNAQIITMGAKVIGIETAKIIIQTYLQSSFEECNSSRKIQQIIDKEHEVFK